MHIITYNIQRLTPFKNLAAIQQLLLAQNADIIVLTESDTRFTLPGYEIQHSDYANDYEWNGHIGIYKPTERRISILSKHPFIKQLDTFNNAVALACYINLNGKQIIVYGTVLGITGKNDNNFDFHWQQMQKDWEVLARQNNLVIAGDFNISFADNYYTNAVVRSGLQDFFIKNKLTHITAGLPMCIDHIVVSSHLLQQGDKHTKPISVGTFAEEKLLSDHAGVWVKVG
jgi:endonuclease/exonuclease/phosphatase family metal-dependent hydrolase